MVGRRTKFLLAKARDRAHTLVGLAIAVAHIVDLIVELNERIATDERVDVAMLGVADGITLARKR